MTSILLTASFPASFLGLRLANGTYVCSTSRIATASMPRSKYSRRRISVLTDDSISSRNLLSAKLPDQYSTPVKPPAPPAGLFRGLTIRFSMSCGIKIAALNETHCPFTSIFCSPRRYGRNLSRMVASSASLPKPAGNGAGWKFRRGGLNVGAPGFKRGWSFSR